MPDKYFDKFPVISYANNVAVNITERAVVTKTSFENPYLYYNYQLQDNERPDQLSDRYYNDQYKSWILYLTNNIVDPYYGWYMTDDLFNNYLQAKYNTSIYDLQIKTKYYVNNWFQDDTRISVSTYTALSNTVHKFWEPYYLSSSIVSGYQRVKLDTIINTNQIIAYQANGVNFNTNEIVNIVFDTNNKGKGQVVTSNSSCVVLQHMVNTVLPNNTVTISGSSYLYGTESFSNVSFTSANTVATNIPLEEIIYYTPITIYDYEKDINENKKNIRVLNSTYAPQIAKELKSLLNNG